MAAGFNVGEDAVQKNKKYRQFKIFYADILSVYSLTVNVILH